MTVAFILVTPLFVLLAIAAAPISFDIRPRLSGRICSVGGARFGEFHHNAVRAFVRRFADDRRRKTMVAHCHRLADFALC